MATELVSKVVLRESEEGFSVQCPALPGCWSQGVTEADALANIRDAIQEYLAAIDERTIGEHVEEVRVGTRMITIPRHDP